MSEMKNGYDVLQRLFDVGTFSETGVYTKRSSVGLSNGTEREGVITGYGSVGGELVFAFAQSSDRAKGAMTEAQAEKILRLYNLAEKSGGAVVGVFDCAGVFIEEGSRVLSACSALLNRVREASGVIPQIAWINGPCTGMNAVLASSFDFTVLNVESGSFSFTPAFLGGKGASASVTAKNEEEAAKKVRELLSFLLFEEEADDTLLNRTSEGLEASTEPEKILSLLCDGEPLVLSPKPESSLVTALARIAGRKVGVTLLHGKMTASDAERAADFVRKTDALGTPHLHLLDSEGAANEERCENAKIAAFASLAGAMAEAEMPTVSCVLGSACGIAFSMLASHGIGADLVFALEGAKIGVLSPEAEAQFVSGEERKKGVTLEELTEKRAETSDGLALACRTGDVDEVLPAEMLRPKIVYAFEMLMHGEKA